MKLYDITQTDITSKAVYVYKPLEIKLIKKNTLKLPRRSTC